MNPPHNKPNGSGNGEFGVVINNIFESSPDTRVDVPNIEERKMAFQDFFESQAE